MGQIRTVEFCADRLLNEPIGFVVHARRRFVQDQDRLQKTLDPSSLKSFSYVCPEPVLTNDSVQIRKRGPKESFSHRLPEQRPREAH